MKNLFEKTQIGSLSLSNRFVYSATWDGRADNEGFCTQKNIDYLVEHVHGGAGLVITGMAFVKREGRAAPWQLAVCSDEYIDGLTKMASAVHDAQGKAILQLAHGGCYAPRCRISDKSTSRSRRLPRRSSVPTCINFSISAISQLRKNLRSR
jgi:2,4-dienoyl-CoA reductase-like NADH-dependent reductase (Old Yellow Enzyme family)